MQNNPFNGAAILSDAIIAQNLRNKAETIREKIEQARQNAETSEQWAIIRAAQDAVDSLEADARSIARHGRTVAAQARHVARLWQRIGNAVVGALIVVALGCIIAGGIQRVHAWERANNFPYGKMCHSVFTFGVDTCKSAR